MSDPTRLLAGLPLSAPPRHRADRIRTRCHAALAGRRPPEPRRWMAVTPSWEPLLACVGALFLAESIRLAVRLAAF